MECVSLHFLCRRWHPSDSAYFRLIDIGAVEGQSYLWGWSTWHHMQGHVVSVMKHVAAIIISQDEVVCIEYNILLDCLYT